MNGIVIDKENKYFSFANVYLSDSKGVAIKNKGTTTNDKGTFSYNFPVNSYVTASTIEANEKVTIFYTGQTFVQFILNRGVNLSEAEITANRIKKGLGIGVLLILAYSFFKH